MRLLQQHGNSLHRVIVQYPGSVVSPGSEFCSVSVLEPLFLHHPNWVTIQKIMREGSLWPLEPISKEERIAKNNEFITRGNHISAEKYLQEYEIIVLSEVSQGWMLPLPLNYINELVNGELAPLGIDDKVWSELPNGLCKTKFRLTHDQSFEASRGRSVNSRVLRDQLPPLSYGGCLSRLIHYIVDLRLCHPLVPILGGRSDFKGAYR
jgi:hypothetical protein